MTTADKVIYVVVGIMAAMCVIHSCGCAKDYCARVPKPPAPLMKAVQIEDGVIRGKNLDNVIENMLDLQRYADELGICPCWEEE